LAVFSTLEALLIRHITGSASWAFHVTTVFIQEYEIPAFRSIAAHALVCTVDASGTRGGALLACQVVRITVISVETKRARFQALAASECLQSAGDKLLGLKVKEYRCFFGRIAASAVDLIVGATQANVVALVACLLRIALDLHGIESFLFAVNDE
jgi:hypothetical protein